MVLSNLHNYMLPNILTTGKLFLSRYKRNWLDVLNSVTYR